MSNIKKDWERKVLLPGKLRSPLLQAWDEEEKLLYSMVKIIPLLLVSEVKSKQIKEPRISPINCYCADVTFV